jgi:hypothetical protein
LQRYTTGEEKALKILSKGIASKARWKVTKEFGMSHECIMEEMKQSIEVGGCTS